MQKAEAVAELQIPPTRFPAEGSPVTIHVSDSGNTVIHTGWDEIISINIEGVKTGKVNIFRDFISEEEREKFVSETTAGPMWAQRSHWYFLDADAAEYFVIRPSWGRHFVLNLATGNILAPDQIPQPEIAAAEKEFVLHILNNPLESCACCGSPHAAGLAAYLAGELRIREAIPALRTLEDHPSINRLSTGGFGNNIPGRVNPFNHGAYGTRQTVHLALRRLGETPGPYPATRFQIEHENFHERTSYQRTPVPGSREENAPKITKGMTPEQVIDLIDCPDDIVRRTWHYDIDASEPYTLTLTWTREHTVDEIQILRPALWQEGTIRDQGW